MADDDVSYWKTKYELLQEQFNMQKKRNEELEDRLLDMVEKIETDKLQLSREIDDLRRKLEGGSPLDLTSMTSRQAIFEEPDDPIIQRSTLMAKVQLNGKKASGSGERGFLDFPVLAMEEGFIYGFRWTKGSVVKVV